MSDTAIFISISADELSSNGQLPGDLRTLRNLTTNDERVVHLEVISDAPLPEKTATALHAAGALLTVLPSASDSSAALVGGLMSRLHEFICAYSHVSQFILAGNDSDRLVTPAAFLQRAGYYVIVAGPDRGRLDALRLVTDDLAVWSGRQSRRNDRNEDRRDDRREDRREETAPQLDPYEVLVDEVTRGREKDQRVLLTSLKQRMRRRMRRFDETRMKDQEGRPMRKFKDFIADAASRDLIQLVENGNRSHVLLPGEEIPVETEDDDNNNTEERAPRATKSSSRKKSESEDSSNDGEVDPLLDTVDMVEGEAEAPVVEQDLAELTEEDFDVENVNEDAPAPSSEFIQAIESFIPENGLTLPDLLKEIAERKEKSELDYTNREIKKMLQNAFFNELLEPMNDEKPHQYIVVDDWKGIIDFL
ncbi:hypothetical protein P3T73_11620 [Kiritimatiellota bacterium B12222]|nr:hypothetical protein P3T73_11620 [Kiritimatiellota bacterium B12222]